MARIGLVSGIIGAALLVMALLFATDYAAWIIAIVAAVFVVVVVIGLHVWGAIQDGREEKANWRRRHPDG